MSNRIQELDGLARVSLPVIDASISPSEYFRHGANCLKQAGEYRKNNDIEMAYLYLMKYFILITESMPTHPNLTEHIDEFHYNCEKCAGRVSTELDNLRQLISPPKSRPVLVKEKRKATGEPVPSPSKNAPNLPELPMKKQQPSGKKIHSSKIYAHSSLVDNHVNKDHMTSRNSAYQQATNNINREISLEQNEIKTQSFSNSTIHTKDAMLKETNIENQWDLLDAFPKASSIPAKRSQQQLSDWWL